VISACTDFVKGRLAFIFMSGFVLLYVQRSVFYSDGILKTSTLVLSILCWIVPPALLLLARKVKDYYSAALKLSLWLIFSFGTLCLLFYYLQSDWLLGKWILDPAMAEKKEIYQSFQKFFQIAYLFTFVVSAIFTALFQASLQAFKEDAKRAKLLQLSILNLALLLIVLILLNLVANLRPFSIDMSMVRQFSLSPQGRAIVKNIERPVKITAFYAFFGEFQRQIQLLLDDMKATNNKIEYTILDAHRDRKEANAFKVSDNGVLIFQSTDTDELEMEARDKQRRVIVSTRNDLKKMEREFVSALLAVTQPKKVIYFSSSHGEYAYTGPFLGDLISNFYDTLRKQGYELKYLNRETGFPPEVPEEADLVIIAGAQRGFSKVEGEALISFLERGNKLFLALDPLYNVQFDFLLNRFQLRFVNQKIYSDIHPKIPKDTIVAKDYSSHPITERLMQYPDKHRMSVFPGAGYFKEDKKAQLKYSNFEKDFFISSNIRSWLDVVHNGVNDPKVEPMSPKKIAVAISYRNESARQNKKVKNQLQEMRLVATADSNFLTNQHLGFDRNLELAFLSIQWLLEDEKIMGLLPTKLNEGKINLSGTTDDLVFYFLVFLWPIGILVLGLTSVRIRKKKYQT